MNFILAYISFVLAAAAVAHLLIHSFSEPGPVDLHSAVYEHHVPLEDL